MALSRTKVTVPLTDGVALKVGKADRPIGSMLSLENATMVNPGQLAKRPGWKQLSRFTTNGDSLASGSNIAQLGSELFAFDGTTAYSYLNEQVGWVPKQVLWGAIGSDSQVVRNAYAQSQPTVASAGGFVGYSYLDSRGGNRATVISQATGTVVVDDVLIDDATQFARAVSFNGSLFFFYTEGGDVLYVNSPGARPTLLGAVNELFQLVFTHDADSRFFDVCLGSDGNLYFAWSTASGGTFVGWLKPDLTIHGPTNVLGSGYQVKAIACTSLGKLWLAVVSTTGTPSLVNCPLTPGGLGSQVAFVTDPGLTTSQWGSVVLFEQPNQPGTVTGLFEVPSGAGTANPTSLVYTSQFNLTTLVNPTLRPWMNGVQLASKAFNQNGTAMVCVQWLSQLQPGLFVVTADDNRAVVAKDRYEALGTGIGLNGVVGDVASLGSNQWLIALLDGGSANPLLNVVPGQAGPGVGGYQLSFDPQDGFDTASVDDYTVVATGAGLQVYDGAQFTEDNFFIYPEAVSATLSSTGSLPAGVYVYAATYAWTDAQGGVVRSAQSVELTVSLSQNGSIDLSVPTLRLTGRDPQSIVIELWRSQADPTFQAPQTQPSMNLLAELANAPQYGPQPNSVTFHDETPDLSIAGNELLYTAGGTVLDFTPAPPGSIVSTFDNRIWVGGLAGAPNSLAFSNTHVPGQPIRFNDYTRQVLDSLGGSTVTALGNMNDQFIVFKERSVYRLWGTGPDPTGANNNYSARLVSSDAGCTEPRSIVLQGAAGLLFKSQKGIYVFDGNQTSYKGADVEPFNAFRVTGAVLASNVNQVRFCLDSSSQEPGLTNSGVMLVWDYYVNKWMIYTGLDAAGCCIYNGVHTLIKEGGEVWYETDPSLNYCQDPYGFYGMSFELNEIQPFGQLGYFYAYDCFVGGSYVGPHTLEVAFAFDGAPWPSQVTDLNAVQTFGPFDQKTYGNGGGVYGTSTTGSFGAVYGGVYAPYNTRWNVNNRASSIRVRVTELQVPGYADNSQGMVVSTVLLNVADLGTGPWLAPIYQN